jgi:hypothetical protein
MATQGTATVNFGSGATDASVAVTGQGAITTANLVEAWPLVSGNDDSPWVEHMTAYAGNIINGTGFTIYVKPAVGFAFGSYSIGWVWN